MAVIVRCSERWVSGCPEYAHLRPGRKTARCKKCREMTKRVRGIMREEPRSERTDDENAAIYESLMRCSTGAF